MSSEMIELRPMSAAPRGGGTHIIGVTNWDQFWVIAFDSRREEWMYGHGEMDTEGDGYFKGWLPYHGIEIWEHWREASDVE